MYRLDLNSKSTWAFVIFLYFGFVVLSNFINYSDVPKVIFLQTGNVSVSPQNYPQKIMETLSKKGYESGKDYSVSYFYALDTPESAEHLLLNSFKASPKIVVTLGTEIYKVGLKKLGHRKGRSYIFIRPDIKSFDVIKDTAPQEENVIPPKSDSDSLMISIGESISDLISTK